MGRARACLGQGRARWSASKSAGRANAPRGRHSQVRCARSQSRPTTTLRRSAMSTCRRTLDESLANGKYYYMKNGFLNQLSDDGIDLHPRCLPALPGAFPVVPRSRRRRLSSRRRRTRRPSRIAARTTGWAWSRSWPQREGAEAKIEKIRAAWKELEPLTQGFYANLADADEPLAAYRENYGPNLERLIALKAKYDPTNLFRLNANVPPKA